MNPVVKMPRISWVLLIGTGLLHLCPGAEVAKAPVPKSSYLPVVYRYVDTMIERGRDNFGPQKTGLFLSALDRTTLAPLTNRPPAPSGLGERERAGARAAPLVGANPQHDENLLRLLYLLSELSAKPRYRAAADGALKWFLEHASSPAKPLLPWGARQSWNVMTDEADGKAEDSPDEFFRPWLLWDRCFEIAPKASRAYAFALSERQLPDRPFPASDRQSGFHLRTWAVAYAQTKDERFLKSMGELLERLENQRDPKSRRVESFPGQTNDPVTAMVSLAIDCDGAAHRVPEPLAARLRALAARQDERFCALRHALGPTRGFVRAIDPASREPAGASTPLWAVRAGDSSTAQIGMMCVSRYDNAGHLAYRDLMTAAADAYLEAPPPKELDAWPVTFGQAISLELAAWRHTARPGYLECARKLGDLAVERFWGTNALPRASLGTDHYAAITGADTLALALVELHLNILHITAVRCPPNTIDR